MRPDPPLPTIRDRPARPGRAGRFVGGLLLALACAGCGPGQAPEAGPSIRITTRTGDLRDASFEVVGLDANGVEAVRHELRDGGRAGRRFRAQIDDGREPLATDGRLPPLAADLELREGVLRFTPRYRLQPGARYRVVFDPSFGTRAPAPLGVVSALFTIPRAKPAARPEVVRVDPAIEVVPENLLKLYVHFSAPVDRGDVYESVHLLDDRGTPVDLPFLELGEELWDPSGKRLTLLFDPGRIKRGLKPRELAGPILEDGRRYTFVVDGDGDRAGLVGKTFRHPFRVGPPDDTPVDPKRWALTSPEDERAAVRLALGETLDRAMLERRLGVVDGEGRPVDGEVTVSAASDRWHFRPKGPWKPGRYTIQVPTSLEDLAGNQVGRAFEVDLLGPIPDGPPRAEFVSLPFEVKSRP